MERGTEIRYYRRRRVSKLKHVSLSPGDSGYCSLDSSQEDSPLRRPRRSPKILALDGVSSIDDSSEDQSLRTSDTSDENRVSISSKRARSISAPGALDGGFDKEKAPSPPCEVLTSPTRLSKRKTSGSTQTPDRFVPMRDPRACAAVRYRTTKQPELLSPMERIARQTLATSDPFVSRRMTVNVDGRPIGGNLIRPEGPVHASVQTILTTVTDYNGRARSASQGTVWTIGGLAPAGAAVDNRPRRRLRSTTNTRIFTTTFPPPKPSTQDDLDKYHGRVLSALDIDPARKVLDFVEKVESSRRTPPAHHSLNQQVYQQTTWTGSEWISNKENSGTLKSRKDRVLPHKPFRVLDAPTLRDDFYCSILAFSPMCQSLAVGLGNVLYTWSEEAGVNGMHGIQVYGIYLTSVAFSSTEGAKCILAIGRSDGSLVLQSTCDSLPRFDVQQPYAVSCVSWRPRCVSRPSKNPVTSGTMVQTEELLVGDDRGTIYYYVVEWPVGWDVERDTWPGSLTLVAKITVHSRQICGLSWAPNGRSFASGGNDDLCCLFNVENILPSTWPSPPEYRPTSGLGLGNQSHAPQSELEINDQIHALSLLDADVSSPDGAQPIRATGPYILDLGPGSEKHCWVHGAAVKAIAFCPWRDGLVATGGGSNDRAIHFFHTSSGATLATIAVSAQVTSLIWSSTRREIVATFGYSQPDHPYRIAVFSWPECVQVAAVPWDGELRALYAIAYPFGPLDDHRVVSTRRLTQEGCIVVASSDSTVKFHEVWSRERSLTFGGSGTLGGSDILELLEGNDKEGDVIR